MKICPVCNDSFADQLNFCDVDGARLTREGSGQERNKWWSLLGAGLLVGALVISAASIIFLPKARVSPVVNSEPQPSPAPAKPQPVESVAAVSGTAVSPEPENVPSDGAAPEAKKKDKAASNANAGEAAPNPKAAALAAEGVDQKAPSTDANSPALPAPKKPEAPPSAKSVSDQRSTETAARPQNPTDLKKDQKTQPAIARASDKDANDKKKADDKDKKKGGFLRVFKKIFGKD